MDPSPEETPAESYTAAAALVAALAGLSAERARAGFEAHVGDAIAARVRSIPGGDANERAIALRKARGLWLRRAEGAGDHDALSALGSLVVASLVASSPASVRASIARSFDGPTLRSAALAAGRARTCDPIALPPLLALLSLRLGHAPDALSIGALVLGSQGDDRHATTAVLAALRSARARGVDARALLSVFVEARS